MKRERSPGKAWVVIFTLYGVALLTAILYPVFDEWLLTAIQSAGLSLAGLLAVRGAFDKDNWM